MTNFKIVNIDELRVELDKFYDNKFYVNDKDLTQVIKNVIDNNFACVSYYYEDYLKIKTGEQDIKLNECFTQYDYFKNKTYFEPNFIVTKFERNLDSDEDVEDYYIREVKYIK